MHLLPYALRRLLHRPKRARKSALPAITIRDQREHDLHRYRPRPSIAPRAEGEQDLDQGHGLDGSVPRSG
jgi:hypothetical protein